MPAPAVTTKSGQVVAAAVFGIQNVIGQAQAVLAGLASKSGRCGGARWRHGANRWMALPSRSASKELPHRFHLHEARRLFPLHLLHVVEQLQGFGLVLRQGLVEISLVTQVAAI